MAPAGPVGLISNPRSGHNRDQFNAVSARVAACPAIRHVVTQSPTEIDAALARLAAAGIRTLAINGGDGTAAAILGRLLETGVFATPPQIALLPGGTANMTAGDVGVGGSLARAVRRLCQWCEGGRTARGAQHRALLRVVNGAEAPRYGMFLGAGAIINGTEYAHRELHSRGLRDDFSLALGTARTVWGVLRDDPRFNRHVAIGLSLDGGPPRQFDTLILAVSTLRRLAFGMRPFWGGEPGTVRLTLFEQGCPRFARTFISIIRGRPSANAIPGRGYHSHGAERAVLELHGNLNLDGEILAAAGPVAITASAPLEFLQL